jgi:methyl-accepting chemotaxis protein
MQKLHRINLISLWACSIVLIGYITAARGLEGALAGDIGMTVGPILVTILFFSKASDVIKGSGLTIIIAITTLVVSISQGGNEATFIVSFAMMGQALLYFDKRILIALLVTYLPISIVVGIINPAYIAGPHGGFISFIERIIIYAFVGVLLVIATNRAGKIIDNSNHMLRKIQDNAKTTGDVIQQLNVSMAESAENIGSLSQRIQAVNDATDEMEALTEAMNSSAAALNTLVSDTMSALNHNAELNHEMEREFEQVGAAVQSGSEGADQVKTTINTMKETVLAAGEAAEILLNKISSVSIILKEINKITMRTNMLSINASIEAAKAGEHGKGFSVVANEIKGLADESSESAKSIESIIGELSVQVDDVAAKTAAGTKSAIAGMESMEKLLGTLEEIKLANDIATNVVMQETQTNAEVNSHFETVTKEISNLVNNVISLSEAIESVSADIHKQNLSVKNVNAEIEKMKTVAMSLNTCEEIVESQAMA